MIYDMKYHRFINRVGLSFLFVVLHNLTYSIVYATTTASTTTRDPWRVDDRIDYGSLNNANKFLKDILQTAEEDILNIEKVKMTYSIFKGKSALRTLPRSERHLLYPEIFIPSYATTNNIDHHEPTNEVIVDTETATAASHRLCAMLLFLRGHADAAHEMILGVTRYNINDAEYAATNRGKTSWTKDHPLSDTADMIHGIIHRLEGNVIGEGNHTGYENAKYWFAGGPKQLSKLTTTTSNNDDDDSSLTSIRQLMKLIALKNTPYCVKAGVISPPPPTNNDNDAVQQREHIIISGGGGGEGKTRKIKISPNEWDPFAFVDICEQVESGNLLPCHIYANEIKFLQRCELILLLRLELQKALGMHLNK